MPYNGDVFRDNPKPQFDFCMLAAHNVQPLFVIDFVIGMIAV